MPDEDITFTDLVRGDVTFQAGSGAGLRDRPRRRGSPLYTLVNPVDDARDGDHPRAPRRGPALLHPAPDRALPCAGRDRRRHARAGLRAPAARPRRGQQEAVQARPAVQPVPAPRPRLHPRGHAQLPGHCWAGPSPTTTTCSPWTSWSAAFDIHDVNANPARLDQKKAEAINAEHIRVLGARGLHAPAWCPTCSGTACCRRSRPMPTSSGLPPSPRWCRRGSTCSRRPRRWWHRSTWPTTRCRWPTTRARS